LNCLNAYFGFERHRTSLSREVIAGLTTFTTMSYIVVVNPAILSTAGIPEGPSFVATVLVAVAGCYLMAFYANRPFAIAPYMGENAFVAFTVCKALGFAWQTALAAIFIAGILFILMTVLRPKAEGRGRRSHLASLQLRRGNRIISYLIRPE
jgi:AGZA family xanthine/uracil permease-like MFS transporter